MTKGKPRPAYGLRPSGGARGRGGGGMMGQLQKLQEEFAGPKIGSARRQSR